MQKISVFGLGYVGAVTAACLASKGHRVLGVDVNSAKVAMLEAGRSPVLEPGLGELTRASHSACRLHATTNAATAIHDSDVSFVCVGTPSMRRGKLDLSSVERSCHEVGEALRSKKTFHWTVLGGADSSHFVPLREIYDWVPGRIFETSLRVSEMVKYVCNTFHALKVAFANEVGVLCKEMGADAQAVTEIFTSDTKLNISPAYLTPGFAFGGSCLPKDVRAFTYRAKELDQELPLLGAIMPSNDAHIDRAIEAVLRTRRKKVGVLGLSFKAKTDDLRESPLVQLIKHLLGEGCQILIWDRDVTLGRLVGSNRQYIEDEIPHIGSLLRNDLQEVVKGSEVIVVGTSAFEMDALQSALRPDHVVIDLVSPKRLSHFEDRAIMNGLSW